MSKTTKLTAIALMLSSQTFSQISFSDQTTALISDTTVYSGVALGIADMNDDNLDDIIRLDNAKTLQIEYQQSDGSTFVEYVYGSLGPSSQWSMCIADVDENGYNDIFTGGAYNGLRILKANATGDSYTSTPLSPPSIFLQGSNFADIDNNGSVDIFACHDDGVSSPYSNDGNGNFTHDIGLIDASSTVPSDNSGNYGSIWTDYDNDGDLDMYLSKCRLGVSNPNDGRRINLLFQNDGSNNYTDVALDAGLQPLAQSWAADFGDVDNDGDLDCFIINHDMTSQIYENNGDGTFTDFTSTSGMTADLATAPLGIQCIFDDFDNDGFVDLLYTSRNNSHFLFQNNGDMTFTSVTDPFPLDEIGIQSAVTGDLNNDGYLDVYAAFAGGFNSPNSSRPDKLFINDESGSNYLKLLLKGDNGNLNAIGARAEIYGAWGVQVREVRAGESYGIMNSFTLHFGLGTETVIDSLLIKWPSGVEEKMCGLTANQSLVLTKNALPDLLNANFSFTDNAYEVSFTDSSDGIPDSWDWDFGDGTSSTLQNPVHTFPDEGPYTITLTCSNDCETTSFVDVWEFNQLPLELLSFTGELIEKDRVALRWTTENEVDFDYFELERSVDLHDSKIITTLAGRNNSLQNHYEWIDRFPEIGKNYYRLKQVDLDGSFEYSDWVNVNNRHEVKEIQAYPNPVKQKLFVTTGNAVLEFVKVYNTTGKLILERENESGNFNIDTAEWESGIYFLGALAEGEWQFIRFSKF